MTSDRTEWVHDLGVVAFQLFVVKLAERNGRERFARRWRPMVERRLTDVADHLRKRAAVEGLDPEVVFEEVIAEMGPKMGGLRHAVQAQFSKVVDMRRGLAESDEGEFWQNVRAATTAASPGGASKGLG